MKFVILAIFSVLWISPAAAQQLVATPTYDCAAEGDFLNTQMKTASYADFELKGWRTLASKNCFFDAGRSIVSWLSANQQQVTEGQYRSLRYQAARVFAMAGRTQVSLVHLKNARNVNQQLGDEPDWNAFIDSFIAWLKRDRTELMLQLSLLEAQSADDTGFRPNLIAARRFLACYDLSYDAIETNPICLQGAQDMNDILASNSDQTDMDPK